MRPHVVSGFRSAGRTDAGLAFHGPSGERWTVEALEPWLFRVRFLPEGVAREPRTWAVVGTRPVGGPTDLPMRDVPRDGRLRDDLSVFGLPPLHVRESSNGPVRLDVDGGLLSAEIDPEAGRIVWQDVAGEPFAADLAARSWVRDLSGRSLWHYMERRDGESHLGFGEVSGPLEKAGCCVPMRPMDALGYDAETGGPLYKHWPFFITVPSEGGPAYGLFYDTAASCLFDLGREVDAYYGPYRYVRLDDGDLDCYLVFGPALRDVVRRFSLLIGRPRVPPRWSLGYLGSSMAYAEAANAQERLGEFLQLCDLHQIPCSGFHLSSGYTLRPNGRRYVFTWDHGRFPDPERMSADFHTAGQRLIANIKPCLLEDHPAYDEVAAFGGFVQAGDDASPGAGPSPHRNAFWDGTGSYLDFTNPRTWRWWQQQVTGQLLQKGIDGTWNDNNEYEVWDDDARCDGFGRPLRAGLARPLQPLLMARASLEAQEAHAPGERALVITRSASPGAQRYAWTWSGDNRSDWAALRFSIPMSLGLGLSGFALGGHDVGGFSGPAPDPELFLRWLETGILYPRFSIHSWRKDGTSNEPWMYPEILQQVRALIQLRYRLIPYLYSLAFAAAREGDPILRALAYEFPDDSACRTADAELMVGPSILAANVVEQGIRTRRFRLPTGASWYALREEQWHAGGSVVELASPPGSPILLGREGGFLPLADDPATVLGGGERPGVERPGGRGGSFGELTVRVFPPESGEGAFDFYEDDGVSTEYVNGRWNQYRLQVKGEPDSLRLSATVLHAGWSPLRPVIVFALPAADKRTVSAGRELGRDASGRRRIAVPVETI